MSQLVAEVRVFDGGASACDPKYGFGIYYATAPGPDGLHCVHIAQSIGRQNRLERFDQFVAIDWNEAFQDALLRIKGRFPDHSFDSIHHQGVPLTRSSA